ncbi:MAG: alpha/beta fold hydrolase [Planctomycetia bacterium]|nr:MAG: alpha/beta fold hydrolase [Planctomycetia bacterium]
MSIDVVFRIPTSDGGSVAGWRKRADGPPVIFLHGLAVNGRIWNVPALPSPVGGFTFRSLAELLHARGHDCWLANFRGHGAPDALSEPAPGQRDWCVDHFAAIDLPAVVEHVQRATGQRPILVGNSMGAMVVSAWLLGATIDAGATSVALCDSAGAQRHDSIRGCVLVEFPAALRWPNSAYDAEGRLRWGELLTQWGAEGETGAAGTPRDPVANSNYPFELLSNSWILQAIMTAAGTIDLKWLRPAAGRDGAPASQPTWLRWLDDRIAGISGFLAERLKGSQHFSPETFTHGLRAAVDHMKSGVLEQMGRSVRARGFVSGLGAPPVSYSDAYARFRAPLLLVLGGRDRIANADVARSVFYERVSSTDKRLLHFPHLAHGDFEYAPRAYTDVYPGIVEWVAQRSTP